MKLDARILKNPLSGFDFKIAEHKLEFFKEHLNSGKSAYELEKEFETWYEEDCKKKQYDDYHKQLNDDIQKESEIRLELVPSGESNHVASGKCYISRTCTLEAFTNIVALRRAIENKAGTTTIFFKTYNGLYVCDINNLGEIVEASESYRSNSDTLIATKGDYTIYPNGIEEYEIHAYNYVEITKD